MKISKNLNTVLSKISNALSSKGENDRLLALSKIYLILDDKIVNDFIINPYSVEFKKKILDLYYHISGREYYKPTESEKTEAIDRLLDSEQPLPYRLNDSELVAQHLSAYSWILFNLKTKKGDSILEYGSGEGGLLLSLARLGCKTYAIDIESRFLKLVEEQANKLGVKVETKKGEFGETFPGIKFDRIIFYEAFHHWVDHQQELKNLYNFLKEDGFICFSGEPIIAPELNHKCKDIIPYYWGPRLDGESIRSINEFGWMELGFTQNYFIDLCIRSGFTVEFFPSPMHWRGDCYIARPIHKNFPIDRNILIKTYSGESGWYQSEGSHIWTNGHAWLPIPQINYTSVSIAMQNFSSIKITVRLFTNVSDEVILNLECNEKKVVNVSLNLGSDYLQIISPNFIPSGSNDTRKLGVAISSIIFN